MAKYKTQRARLMKIDEILSRRRTVGCTELPNCKSMAEELCVSPKTIGRDLDFLRDFEGAPIEYDALRHGFYYREPNYRLPTVPLTESDLFSVLIAQKAMEQYRGTPLFDQLGKVFTKIAASLPDKVTVDPAWTDPHISFFHAPPRNLDPAIWDVIAKALAKRNRVEIFYDSLNARKAAGRRVDPYHLVAHHGDWYLVGQCHQANEVRTFALSRIKRATPLSLKYAIPADFHADKYFGGHFGIMRGDVTSEVKIQFVAKAAPLVKERVWQPEQVIENTSDGGVILTLRLSHFGELVAWLMSWGAFARVLSPPELVTRMKTDLEAAAARYQG